MTKQNPGKEVQRDYVAARHVVPVRTFRVWWDETARFIGPESGVSWEDFRKDSCEMAFEAGISNGMARAGNYVANDATCPTSITFVNGMRVTCVNNVLFLERGKP